ncbi:importin-alpha re-exporter (chromosome segregation 1-like protein) [Schistosoma mansoni]|uniref:importin-alpha re-exporter (chromosome segregation 1-like protein) n=1 Tax=Schistosoma mansoni TaxID=6183 RepID=UPI00022C8777|nr:importin-alpha re-exporter (chromosome segregation 1-like protein) [Schistosoma mansoni]|eukprot:XP_018646276.1 importin-alpha re-exporter (chromosome segregation 1-like protein) [Schistosoma mansoni]
MDPSFINELTNCLQHTVSPERETRRSAEAYLKAVEQRPSYCLCLLHILQDPNIPSPTRIAAAITLKNFIKNYWQVDSDETDRIQASDRQGLRNQLIGAMLSVAGNIQSQLSEAISTIWREDFPEKWPNLIPELVQRMAQLGADLNMVHGVLYTAHTLFKRYRHECAGPDLYREMKLVIGQFGAPLTELAKNLLGLVIGTNRISDASRLTTVLQCLLLVCKIFLSLNCQDLPEFFEDNMQDWMTFFRSLLQIDASTLNLTDGTDENSGTVLVEQIKSQVCDNASLYASKYEPEFASYLPGFVTDVWEMLLGISAQTKYDLLIGNAIGFLSCVISRPQHRYLFENPETLQKLCEKVILPNMHFRALDEELFTENPDEYIRLDLEGSNAQTRRRAACNLVHVLCEAFEGAVVTNFATYIEHLLNEYTNTPNGGAWTSKDAALLLVTSVASRGKTEKHGVTVSTELVNLTTFFENHVLPELQSPNVNYLPVIKADCLRYAIAFRSLLPSVALINLLNMTPVLLTASAPVVQSYVASLIDKLLAMRRLDSPTDPVIPKEQVSEPQLLIDRLLNILNNPEYGESVYVIRALMRVCCCLQERCLPSMTSLVSTLLSRLTQVAKNPSKPDFNHFLFETICLCIRLTCATEPVLVLHFEAAFLPIFQDILQQDVIEFVPYVFQLISVMLEQYPLSQTVLTNCKLPPPVINGLTAGNSANNFRPSQAYSALLQRILVPSLWEPNRNVPSLVRLLQAYLLHNMDDVLAANKITPILGVFQKLVNSSINDVYAFALLNAILLSGPKDILMPTYFRQIFMIIFRRLQTCKKEKFMKAFASLIAHMVLIYSPDELITLVDGIQSNLFARVLEKVLIPYADIIIATPLISTSGFTKSAEVSSLPSTSVCTEWRMNSIGLIRFIGEAQALLTDGSTYRESWLPLLMKIITGLATGPGRGGEVASDLAVSIAMNSMVDGFQKDERFIEIDSDPSGQSAYSQLTFAIQKLPDLYASITDPRVYLAKTLHDLSNASPGKLPVLLNSITEQSITIYLKSLMERSQLCIN